LKCPFCFNFRSRVLDSRPMHEGNAIRRRRECCACSKRFTTFETIEEKPLIVIKKDNSREPFSRQKLLKGLIKSCEKRPVSFDVLERVVLGIEKELKQRGLEEVSSKDIGEQVMARLFGIDEVAYVRFASVYRQFKDLNVFLKELKDLLKESRR